MKKKIVILVLVVLALAIAGIGVVSAQDGTPPFDGRGYGMHDGSGVLHPFMTVELAKKLGMNVDDINTRLANGESMVDIALSAGVSAQDFPTVMAEVRSDALDAAVQANVITQEQAEWMKAREMGRGGMGNGTCDGTGPQGGRGHGSMWRNP